MPHNQYYRSWKWLVSRKNKVDKIGKNGGSGNDVEREKATEKRGEEGTEGKKRSGERKRRWKNEIKEGGWGGGAMKKVDERNEEEGQEKGGWKRGMKYLLINKTWNLQDGIFSLMPNVYAQSQILLEWNTYELCEQ